MLGGDALGMLDAARGPGDQQADPGEADLQEPGAEPVLPGTQDSGDGQRIIETVGRAGPADQRQDPARRRRPRPAAGGDPMPGARDSYLYGYLGFPQSPNCLRGPQCRHPVQAHLIRVRPKPQCYHDRWGMPPLFTQGTPYSVSLTLSAHVR